MHCTLDAARRTLASIARLVGHNVGLNELTHDGIVEAVLAQMTLLGDHHDAIRMVKKAVGCCAGDPLSVAASVVAALNRDERDVKVDDEPGSENGAKTGVATTTVDLGCPACNAKLLFSVDGNCQISLTGYVEAGYVKG